MEPYLFYGVVLPERAQLSLNSELVFQHVTSDAQGRARISIVLNQVVVWVKSEKAWDIFDLRNVVKNIVQTELALVGYLTGHAYDSELTRVLNRDRKVDYVFGIDNPCVVERSRSSDLVAELIGCDRRRQVRTVSPYVVVSTISCQR